MEKYLAELVGTLILVFCGTGAIVINEERDGKIGHQGIAIVFGLVVMAMIYTFGSTSGAHFNPAVSISLFTLHKMEANEMLKYILAQLFGALSASLLLKIMFPKNINLGNTLPSGTAIQSFIMEFILSFILMLVILKIGGQSVDIQKFGGFIVGGVVLLEAMFAGPVCGASMNPARSIGPAVVSGNLKFLWIYIVATIGGMLLAGQVFSFM